METTGDVKRDDVPASPAEDLRTTILREDIAAQEQHMTQLRASLATHRQQVAAHEAEIERLTAEIVRRKAAIGDAT